MDTGTNRVPFFIVGAPRSGTTLLREVLRTHPEFCCPEETHFFRWGHPFGGAVFRDQYFTIPSNLDRSEPIYRLHRQLDGISDSEFSTLIEHAKTRVELQDAYLSLYQARNGFGRRRWFEKSPQNIYGIFLLNALYERPQFIYIVRNPLDVVASLIVGEVLCADCIVEACNYWLEAATIFNQFKAAWPTQAFELKFERLAKSPADTVEDLMLFLGESAAQIDFDYRRVNRKWRDYRAILSENDIATVCSICRQWMRYYGYAAHAIAT